MNTQDADGWVIMPRPRGLPVFYAPGKGFRIEVDASLMMWREATEEEAVEALACYEAPDNLGEFSI